MKLTKKMFWSVLVLMTLLIVVFIIVFNKDNDVKPKIPKAYTENQDIPVYLGHYYKKELGMLNREQFKGQDVRRRLDMEKPTIVKDSKKLHIDFNRKLKFKEYFEVLEVKEDGINYKEEKLLQTSYTPETAINLSKKKGVYKIIIRSYKGEVSTDFGILLNIKE